MSINLSNQFDLIFICTPLSSYKSIFKKLNTFVKVPTLITDVDNLMLINTGNLKPHNGLYDSLILGTEDSDLLQGTSSNDLFMSSGDISNENQIDVITGLGGSDLFVLDQVNANIYANNVFSYLIYRIWSLIYRIKRRRVIWCNSIIS